MSNMNFKSFGLLILSVTILSGCALKKMKKKADAISYEVVPEYLEVHGDSVKVTINGVLPRKYFNRRSTMELNPYIAYEGGQTELKSLRLKGEKIVGDGVVVQRKDGGSFTYTDRVPFNEGMKVSELKLDIKGARKSKTLDFETVKLADGVITTSKMVESTEVAMLGKDKYKKVVPIETSGKVLFDMNKAIVKKDVKKGESITKIDQFIAEGHSIIGIQIGGFASPDGAVDLNTKLSVNRSSTTYDFLRDFLKDKGIAQVNDSNFYKRSNTAEDWAGLKNIAGTKDFEDKDKIVSIVNTVSDVNNRETELKKLTSYRKIAKDLLPPLRRAEIKILANEKRKSDAEISDLAKNNPTQLTEEELLYAASMTENWDEKVAIYSAFMKAFPNDWRGYNNVAYVYLNQGGKNAEAQEMLDKANKLDKDNAIIYNNLGVTFLNQSDLKNAESYYLLAQSFGANESLNLGNVKIRQGDYSSAIAYYGSANKCTFNSGLANTLAGNYDAAGGALNCAPQAANAFYLKAVLGARTGNLDMLTTNLTRAIKEDASMRDAAKKDLEFAAYRDSDTFKVAIR
jgi:tetratricopeptide (TPR) repeat protein